MENKKWVFSGISPFSGKKSLDELAQAYKQPLIRLDDQVYAMYLPYPHGIDHYPYSEFEEYDRDFFHIFNLGPSRDNLTGVAKCVRYETGTLPSGKRVSLAMEDI